MPPQKTTYQPAQVLKNLLINCFIKRRKNVKNDHISFESLAIWRNMNTELENMGKDGTYYRDFVPLCVK